jgi:hypothetical protein
MWTTTLEVSTLTCSQHVIIVQTTMPKLNQLEASVARRLAVQADVDPRTLVKVYRREKVRGAAARRATIVLIEAGLLPKSAALP